MSAQSHLSRGKSSISSRPIATGVGVVFVILVLVISPGCPSVPNTGQDGATSAKSTVVLSAQELGGTDGVLVYQGEEINSEIEVPANALVGVIKDGKPYLYHPALGDEEVSEYNSRRAVGYFLTSLSPPSKDAALRLADKLAVGGTYHMATGVKVERTDETHCKLVNQAARWVAIKTYSGSGGTSKALFFPADELDIPITLIGAIDKCTIGMFSSSNIRTVETPEYMIESYGAIVRGFPLLAATQNTTINDLVFIGAGEALLQDRELFLRVNAVDFLYSVTEAFKSVGRVVSPLECIDLVIPEALVGAGEITAIGLATGDAEALKPIVLNYVKNLINSMVGCVVEFGLGAPITPAGWVAMAINELQDVLSAGKWIVDVEVRGARDVMQYLPYDRIELKRRAQPKSIEHEATIEVGDDFLLTSGSAIRKYGATLRVEYTWVPEVIENCDPDDPPQLDVILSAGGLPVDATESGSIITRQWIIEATTTGEDSLPEIVEFSITVARYDELLIPSWITDHCPGYFEVEASIQYTPAE